MVYIPLTYGSGLRLKVTDNIHPINPNSTTPPPTFGGGGSGGSDVGERLARLEVKMESTATSKDISDLKLWIIGSAFGMVITTITIGTLIYRTFVMT